MAVETTVIRVSSAKPFTAHIMHMYKCETSLFKSDTILHSIHLWGCNWNGHLIMTKESTTY